MAKEKVLLITNDGSSKIDNYRKIRQTLKNAGVEVVDLAGSESKIPFGKLKQRYNIIVIDGFFMFNTRDTTRVVRRLRQEFDQPIIGIDITYGSGNIFELQVAGCNFILPERLNDEPFTTEQRWDVLPVQLLFLIGKIAEELTQPHQKLTVGKKEFVRQS